MKSEIIANELRNLIEEIREQQQLVLSHTGRIPQIEIDILMGNVRKMYEALMHLNKMNMMPAEPQAPQHPGQHKTDELIARVEVKQDPIKTEPVTAAEIENTPPAVVPEHTQPEALVTLVETPVSAPVAEISREEVLPQASLSKERAREFTKPAVKTQQSATLFDDPLTVAEKFHDAPSLHDKISSANEDKSLAGKLQRNPLSDLKKSIGINEKFSFINELFDGDLNAYNAAIEKLNGSESHEAALGYLENDLAPRLGWSAEGESFLQLKNLVDRRFSA